MDKEEFMKANMQDSVTNQQEIINDLLKRLEESGVTLPKPSPITSDTPHEPTTGVEDVKHILGGMNHHLERLKHYQNYYGNVPRVYYRGEEQLEGLVARLRGEMSKMMEAIGDLSDLLLKIINDINAFIDNFAKWMHDIFPKLEVIYQNGDYEPGAHLMDQNKYRQLGRRNEPVALGAYGDWYANYTNSFFDTSQTDDDANKRLYYFKFPNRASDVFGKQKEQVTENAIVVKKNSKGYWIAGQVSRYYKHPQLLFRDDLTGMERVGAEVQRVYVDTSNLRLYYQKQDGVHVYSFKDSASTGVQTPHTSNFLVGTVDGPDGFHLFYISSNLDGSYKLYDYNTNGTDRLVWEIDAGSEFAKALDPASDVFLNGPNEISVKLGATIKSYKGFFHTYEHHKSAYSEISSPKTSQTSGRYGLVLTGITNLDLLSADGRMINNSIMSDLNADDHASGSYGVLKDDGNMPSGDGYMYTGINGYANFQYLMYSTEDNMGIDTYGYHVYKVKPSHAPFYELQTAHHEQVARLTDALGRAIPLSEVPLGILGGDILQFTQTGYYYIEPGQARRMLSFTQGRRDLPSIGHLWRTDLTGVLLQNEPDGVLGTTRQVATLLFLDGDFAEYVRSINPDSNDRTSGMWGYNATSIAEIKEDVPSLANWSPIDGMSAYGSPIRDASDYPYNDQSFTYAGGEKLLQDNALAKTRDIYLTNDNIEASTIRQLLQVVTDVNEIRFSRLLHFDDSQGFVYGYEWPSSVTPWILEEFEYNQNASKGDQNVVTGGDGKQPGNQNVINNITNIYNTLEGSYEDTTTVDFTTSGKAVDHNLVIKADVNVSKDKTNTLSIKDDGLYVPSPPNGGLDWGPAAILSTNDIVMRNGWVMTPQGSNTVSTPRVTLQQIDGGDRYYVRVIIGGWPNWLISKINNFDQIAMWGSDVNATSAEIIQIKEGAGNGMLRFEKLFKINEGEPNQSEMIPWDMRGSWPASVRIMRRGSSEGVIFGLKDILDGYNARGLAEHYDTTKITWFGLTTYGLDAEILKSDLPSDFDISSLNFDYHYTETGELVRNDEQ